MSLVIEVTIGVVDGEGDEAVVLVPEPCGCGAVVPEDPAGPESVERRNIGFTAEAGEEVGP